VYCSKAGESKKTASPASMNSADVSERGGEERENRLFATVLLQCFRQISRSRYKLCQTGPKLNSKSVASLCCGSRPRSPLAPVDRGGGRGPLPPHEERPRRQARSGSSPPPSTQTCPSMPRVGPGAPSSTPATSTCAASPTSWAQPSRPAITTTS